MFKKPNIDVNELELLRAQITLDYMSENQFMALGKIIKQRRGENSFYIENGRDILHITRDFVKLNGREL